MSVRGGDVGSLVEGGRNGILLLPHPMRHMTDVDANPEIDVVLREARGPDIFMALLTISKVPQKNICKAQIQGGGFSIWHWKRRLHDGKCAQETG